MSDIQNTRKTSSRSMASRAIGAAAIVSLFTGCMMFARAPKDLDYSRTRQSEAGLYRGTIRPAGRLDSAGAGSRGGRCTSRRRAARQWTAPMITVDGGMPQHGHGLPTKPRVTRALGNGDHLVEGMKFNMGGWWVVKFRVNATRGQPTRSCSTQAVMPVTSRLTSRSHPWYASYRSGSSPPP